MSLSSPATLLWNLWLSPRPQKYFLLLVFGLLILMVLKMLKPLNQKALGSIVIVNALILVSLVIGPNYLDLQIEASVAVVVLFALLCLYSLIPAGDKNSSLESSDMPSSIRSKSLLQLAVISLLGSFLFGAGSTNGVVASASRAMPVLTVSLVALALASMTGFRRRVALLSVAVTVC